MLDLKKVSYKGERHGEVYAVQRFWKIFKKRQKAGQAQEQKNDFAGTLRVVLFFADYLSGRIFKTAVSLGGTGQTAGPKW